MRLRLRLAFRDFEQDMSQCVGVSTNQLDFFVGQAVGLVCQQLAAQRSSGI
jgi:hypothetical protein